jgi:hypothetical protein
MTLSLIKEVVCLNCHNVKKCGSVETKQGKNDILLNTGFCTCHNFSETNKIISRIDMMEVTVEKFLSELRQVKQMVSQYEV